ncbi:MULTISPECIES: helix-turn-helix domain-containing protein [Enterococcus]|uniref:DNA-binding helix-turn-helix protein n=1 Tax=Enterococcus faecium SD2A-2 TaxID=1244154 RepID=A0AB73A9Q4_ENTFC|nr:MULTISPECIES: helix-turn-helix domain-containing protein [Enterococcus]EGO9937317.1 helix-turn-helix domain-containing protein [Enterococcus faecium]EGP4736832.1 helix-turn-helix domain-containing protein [Enterococcus faecium]EGP4770114.1 helix-turn-helix domain-containing protein [Enterococcus faecium]EGP4777602.1 helix-turn-helix domain-containing protein [Enterococcus faecium]EGP4876921.1 helix-turn-helix domain-containing protein [Enterococcus faecium]
MIKVDGALLKEYRKKKGLTQVQLAEGICEQATVSNIENKNMSPGINILSALCKKLNVEISDILVETEEDKIRKKLSEIQSLNAVSKYKESYEILQTVDQKKVSNSDLLNQILFYQGLLDHLYAKKEDAALFYFNQVLEQTTETDIHHLQAAANVAMIYLAKGELDFAKVYVERTLKILNDTDFDNLMVCAVYYNIATYYSKIENYEKAIQLCEKGIEYNKKHKSTHSLEYLLYEIAFCHKQLGEDDYLERYMDAKKVACFNGNDHAVKVIENDLK